jgi:hypothetical protein
MRPNVPNATHNTQEIPRRVHGFTLHLCPVRSPTFVQRSPVLSGSRRNAVPVPGSSVPDVSNCGGQVVKVQHDKNPTSGLMFEGLISCRFRKINFFMTPWVSKKYTHIGFFWKRPLAAIGSACVKVCWWFQILQAQRGFRKWSTKFGPAKFGHFMSFLVYRCVQSATLLYISIHHICSTLNPTQIC